MRAPSFRGTAVAIARLVGHPLSCHAATMPHPWEILKQSYLIESPWINVRVDAVKLHDGVTLPTFYVVEFPDWAAVLCFTKAGEVVLVEQYRHGIGEMTYELPAGALEVGEDPLAAAQRELLEETGYAAPTWVELGRCAPDPSKQTNHAYLYVALDAECIAQPVLDHSEDLALHHVAWADVLAMAEAGQIQHGIHLTAIFWAAARGLVAHPASG